MIWLLKVVFDLSLTPILTTLGVGGIAVALALQDTLSNLFAGFYVSISGLVRIGDYIKLNTGEEGYITDINWRCTTMRGYTNNLVVIPNNKLGQAIFTNYYLPEPRMMMSVTFGVGYESDIDRVEAILLDEAISAAGQIDGLLADPAPYVRFIPGPGDWALGFQVNYNVAEFADQYLVQSELRKRIFKRLKKEGISMPFPTQTVIVGAENSVMTPAPEFASALTLNDTAPGRALDLACGSGRNARWLVERGWDVTAVDIEAVEIAGCKMRPGRSRTPRIPDRTRYVGSDRVLALLAAGSVAGDCLWGSRGRHRGARGEDDGALCDISRTVSRSIRRMG